MNSEVPEKIKDKLINLPDAPGVYLMKNINGRVIYVGKAKRLKNRVRSYFQAGRIPDPKTFVLISKIADFDVVITDSEIEALILEANLIKEYRPRYNVNLKDDKRFPYIKITMQEPFPRVIITRVLQDDGSRYFGPYTDAGRMRSTVDFLHRLFPLRTCTSLPGENDKKPCLNYQINRCLGICMDNISENDYRIIINNIIRFLSGRKRELVAELREQMRKYSESLNFEAAARCRDQIEAIEKVVEKQKVVNTDRMDRDFIGTAEVADDGCFSVFQVRDGVLLGRQHFYYRVGSESKPDFLKNFIVNYYKTAAALPAEVITSSDVADRELLEQWLTGKDGHKVSIVTPQKGRKAGLLNLADSNASLLLDELLAQKQESKTRLPHSVYELEKALNLPKPPRTISAFDISNLGESEAVGSMVFFADGKPKKSNYRHFRIKRVEGQDDFAMMAEVIERYFKRTLEQKEQRPDLVLIDGGKGQLNAAIKVLRALKIELPAASLAKRIDEVFVPGRKDSIIIAHVSPALKLLQRVRDEAHRFAVEYHRKLRGKKMISSELDRIPGIGEVRKFHLLVRFGSVDAVSRATFADLLNCPGISRKVAAIVYEYFHPQSTAKKLETAANDN